VEELNLFQKPLPQHQKGLFINYGDAEAFTGLAKKLRAAGIKVELYPDNNAKWQNSFNMPIREIFLCSNSGTRNSFKFFSLKNLVSGEQVSLDFRFKKGVIVI
jgi:histidyl-tRNA synthetase